MSIFLSLAFQMVYSDDTALAFNIPLPLGMTCALLPFGIETKMFEYAFNLAPVKWGVTLPHQQL